MDYNINDVITFKDGEYLVVDVVRSLGNTYLYLINNNEFLNDVSITKVVNRNGKVEYDYINDGEEFEFVMNKIFSDMGEQVVNLVSEE